MKIFTQIIRKSNPIFTKASKLLAFVLILFSFSIQTKAQTVHISATGNGGFESGTSFTANGWSNTSGTSSQNQWVVSTGASGYSGNRCAYVTNDTSASPPPNSYTINANHRTHFYRNITIASGETDITLSFKWKGNGQTNQDMLRVWAVPTSFTPIYGTGIGTTGSAPTGRVLLGSFLNESTWQFETIKLSTAYAGTSFRLVFEWINNNSNGTQNPASVDDISLVSEDGPINDNCSNAISLTVNSETDCDTGTTGTTIAATQSQAACSGTADDDVWYSFVATSTYHFVTVSAGTMTNPVLQVFRGNCGSLTSVVCRNAFSNDNDEVATLTGLIIGDTYYVRVHSQANGSGQGTFTICITTLPNPVNDNCSNAIDLEVNPDTDCTTTTSGTTSNGTQSQSGCSGTADDDVWYSFVATSTYHFVTVSAGTMTNPVLQVFRGNCGSLTNVVCRNAFNNNNDEVATLTGLTIGDTYYVRVYSQGNGTGQGTFTLCVTTIPNPINDNCSNAINVPVSADEICTSPTAGNSVGGSQSLSGCSGTADDDVWFSFVATSSNHLIKVTPFTMTDVVFQVYSGNCGSLTSIACINSTSGTNPESSLINSLLVGNTYYIRVYSSGNGTGQGTFNICITTPAYVRASTTAYTVPSLVRDILFENSCVNISNISWRTGTNYSDVNGIGYFQNDNSSFPFENGILLSTGNALFAEGPIDDSKNSTGGGAWAGDANVQSLMSLVSGSPQTSYNASVLEFDFTPFQDTISFDFIFASNEYGTYQCNYSDTFVFLLTNVATGVTTNIAVIPSTTTPISVITIRDNVYNNGCGSVNSSLFDNYYYDNPNLAPINFRGTTIPLTAIGSVIPGQQYHIKLAIADRADNLFDSAVFIKGSSFSIGNISMGDDLLTLNNTALCHGETEILNTNLDPAIFDFKWYKNNVVIPSATGASYTVNSMGNYTVKVALKNNSDCFNEASVIVEIFPQIVPQTPANLRQCDFVSTFDLTANSATLLASYPSPTYTVSYYTTLVDAQNNTNQIINPETYTEISNPQTIYSRVFNVVKGCYGIKTFKLRRPKTWNGSTNIDWNTDSNWTPSGVPTKEDCIIIYAATNQPIISGTAYDGYGYNLEVRANASLKITDGNSLSITNRIIVEPTANFEIGNNASLIQIDNISNIGNITYKRNASIRKVDYVYWSSPVSNFHVNALSPGTPASVRFFWNTTVANTNGGFGNWNTANEIMTPGKGYIVRGPNNFNTTLQTFTASFTGIPNNGDISIPISRGNYTGTDYAGTNGVTITNMDDNFNLIGNPYPSAILFTDFMAANSDLEGSIRVWTHGSLPNNSNGNPFYGSFAYNYTSNDYIIHNATGTISGPDTYDGFIPAGQSFFVAMLDGAETTSSVNFTNAMRVRNQNTQFYRHANTSNTDNNFGNSRIWLDLVSSTNAMSRTLVGYIEGASNEKDRLYDAYTKIDNPLVLYSLIDTEKACIQGRALPFDIMDSIPLGFKITTAGDYNLAIAALDGIFNSEQTVFLKDNLLGVTHNLSQNPYPFTATNGVYNDRFEIVFTNETLGVNQSTDNGIRVITNDKVTVYSSHEIIKEIMVFDILGRQLNHYKSIQSNEFTLNEQKNKQALLLKITLDNGLIIDKKILY